MKDGCLNIFINYLFRLTGLRNNIPGFYIFMFFLFPNDKILNKYVTISLSSFNYINPRHLDVHTTNNLHNDKRLNLN